MTVSPWTVVLLTGGLSLGCAAGEAGAAMMEAIRARSPTARHSAQALFVIAVLAVLAEVAALGFRTHQLRVGTATPTSTAQVISTVPPPPTPVLPTTTLPPAPTATTAVTIGPPVSAPGSITYTVPKSTQVTVAAIKDCWVEARPDASGKVLSAQTLPAGQSEKFPAPVWLRFGNPTAVTVTAGTTTLALPTNGPGDLVVLAPQPGSTDR